MSSLERIDDGRPGYFSNIPYASQRHTDVQLLVDNLQGPLHTILAPGAKTVHIATTKQAPTSAKSERLEDVMTRADTSIEKDFSLFAYNFSHSGQHRYARRSTILLSAPVI